MRRDEKLVAICVLEFEIRKIAVWILELYGIKSGEPPPRGRSLLPDCLGLRRGRIPTGRHDDRFILQPNVREEVRHKLQETDTGAHFLALLLT